MTQNTQTTAERIRNLIFDAIQDSPYGDESIVAAPIGVTIAAEIDALTAELRTANAEIARLMPLPEIYTLWKKIIEDGNPSRDTVAHFVELAHEAAERAAHAPADLRTPTDQRIAALEAQMGALQAEVERLRPAAEAWEAAEKWRAVGMHIENRRGRDDAYQEMDRAAARAREARK